MDDNWLQNTLRMRTPWDFTAHRPRAVVENVCFGNHN